MPDIFFFETHKGLFLLLQTLPRPHLPSFSLQWNNIHELYLRILYGKHTSVENIPPMKSKTSGIHSLIHSLTHSTGTVPQVPCKCPGQKEKGKWLRPQGPKAAATGDSKHAPR